MLLNRSRHHPHNPSLLRAKCQESKARKYKILKNVNWKIEFKCKRKRKTEIEIVQPVPKVLDCQDELRPSELSIWLDSDPDDDDASDDDDDDVDGDDDDDYNASDDDDDDVDGDDGDD